MTPETPESPDEDELQHAVEELRQRRAVGDQDGELECLLHIAELHFVGLRWGPAEKMAKQALRILEERPAGADLLWCISCLAWCRARTGRTRFAAETLSHCPDPATFAGELEEGDAQTYLDAASEVADTCEESGMWEQAASCWQMALSGARVLGQPDREVDALLALSRLGRVQGRDGDALLLARRSLQLARAAGDREGEAQARYGVGYAWSLVGRWRAARRALERGLELYREIGDAEAAAYCQCRLAFVAAEAGWPDTALRNAKAAVETFQGGTNHRMHTEALHCLAEALAAAGELGESGRYMGQVLERYRSNGDGEAERETLLHMAELELHRGHGRVALQRLQESLAIHESQAGPQGPLLVASGVVEALGRAGDVEATAQAAALMHDLAVIAGDEREEGRAMVAMARCLLDDGRVAEAHGLVRGALRIHTEHNDDQARADALWTLADVQDARGDAVRAFDVTLVEWDLVSRWEEPERQVDVLLNLAGRALRAGDTDRTAVLVGEALARSSGLSDPSLRREVEERHREAVAEWGEPAECARRLRQAGRGLFDPFLP